MTYRDGVIFDGIWNENSKVYGTSVFKQTRRKQVGQTINESSYSLTLEGAFENDKLQGRGVASCPSFTYEGNFNKSINGEGTLTFPDGSLFFWHFASGKVQGLGTFVPADNNAEPITKYWDDKKLTRDSFPKNNQCWD